MSSQQQNFLGSLGAFVVRKRNVVGGSGSDAEVVSRFDQFLMELNTHGLERSSLSVEFLLPRASSIIVWRNSNERQRGILCSNNSVGYREVAEWKKSDVTLVVRFVPAHPYYGVLKAVCGRCRYLVTIDDHSARCDVAGTMHSTAEHSSMRRKAWFGDALHTLDVRLAISAMCDVDKDLVANFEPFVTRESQAVYLRAWLAEGKELCHQPLGDTVSQMSQAFEANYIGKFRSEYLERVFPGQYIFDDVHVGKGFDVAL